MGNFFGIYSSYMYRYKDNNLMTTEASSPFGKVDKLKTTSTAYENMIIPNNPQVGRSYELHDNKNDSQIKTVKIVSIEEVEVQVGKFQDCIKISVKTVWKDGEKSSSQDIWLKKEVGMIKWNRTTGRIEELVKYNIPE